MFDINVFEISLSSRIRTVLYYVRSEVLSRKKTLLLIKYVNSFTSRQIFSIILHLNDEEITKNKLINYINLSSNDLPGYEQSQQDDTAESDKEHVEDLDKEEAINEISFINHPRDELDEEYKEAQSLFDCSVMQKLDQSYVNKIESEAIELVSLDE